MGNRSRVFLRLIWMDAVEFCPTALFMCGFGIVLLTAFHQLPGDESPDEIRMMVLGLLMMFTLMGALGSITEGTIKNGPFLRRLPIHKGERVFWLPLENLFLSFIYVTVPLSVAIALFKFPWIAIELILLTWILGNQFVSIFFPLHVGFDSKIDSNFILSTGLVISILVAAVATMVFFSGADVVDGEEVATLLQKVRRVLIGTTLLLCPISVLSLFTGWRWQTRQQTIGKSEPRRPVAVSCLSVDSISLKKPGTGGLVHVTKPYRFPYLIGALISVIMVLYQSEPENQVLVWLTFVMTLLSTVTIFFIHFPILPFLQTQAISTNEVVASTLIFYAILAIGPLLIGAEYGLTLFLLIVTILSLGSFMSFHSLSPLNYDPEMGKIRTTSASDLPASMVGWTGVVLLILAGASSAWLYLHDSWLTFIPFLIPLAYNLWAMTWMYRRY